MDGLPGPNPTETVTGGKTLELSKYYKVRKPHKGMEDVKIKVTTRTLSSMMKNVKVDGNDVKCPHFIELKTCHEKKRGYFCEKKKFPKDYVFHQNPTCKTAAGSAASTSSNDAAANAKCHPYLGICTGCNPF